MISGRSRATWRYLALRRVGDVLPAVAVLFTAFMGIWAGAAVLLITATAGFFTDLAFFEAFKERVLP